MILNVDEPYQHAPGFGAPQPPTTPSLNADRHVLTNVRDQLAAFREGAGKDMDILVDLTSTSDRGLHQDGARHGAVRTSSGSRSTRATRRRCTTSARASDIPVASCECLFGRRDYRPYFEQQSVDVAIVDTPGTAWASP